MYVYIYIYEPSIRALSDEQRSVLAVHGMNIYVYRYVDRYVYVCMYVYIYIYMCVCVYVYMYISR